MKNKILIIGLIFAVLITGITAIILLNENEEILVYINEKETKVASFSDEGETYVSAEDIFSEMNVSLKKNDGKKYIEGQKILEIDEKNNEIKVNGEKSEYDFKNEKGEIMISPYLAGDIIGNEVVINENKIYMIKTKPVSIKFRENNREIQLGYGDDMFAPSSYEYNHTLSKMSLGMAVAAFSSKEADKYWGDNGDFGRDSNIISLYNNMGFENVKTYNYDKSLNDATDKVAFAIGEKTVKLSDKEYRLIALAIRGGAYGNEWVSNFNLGDGKNHTGFDIASEEVVENFKAYTGNNTKNTKLWVTGYSRGAAVANITAAKLEEYLGGENIFAYTFATPNVTMDNERNSDKFRYIYNVISNNDLVPLVAPSQWGYGRYGRDVSFPMMAEYNEQEGKAVADKIGKIYESISPNGTFDILKIENSNQSEQIQTTVQSIVTALKSKENYNRGISPIMMDFIRVGNTKKKDERGKWQWMTPEEGVSYVFKQEGEIILSKAEKDGFLNRAENAFGEIGAKLKAFGAVCIKNGRDPYKVITEEIGVGNLITMASVFTEGSSETGTIAKAHYPESYIAAMLGILNPGMLNIK